MAVNSVLGEQCGSVAKIVKGTNAEFANLPQFLQSSHSPTAMLRILFKKMAFHHCEPCDSKAWQSAAQQVSLENKGHRSALADVSLENHRKILESCAICLKLPESMDCHAHRSARNDRKNAPSKKVDSSYNAPLSSQADTALSPSLRDFRKEVVAIHKQEKQKGI